MKKVIVTSAALFAICATAFAQEQEAAEKLKAEGWRQLTDIELNAFKDVTLQSAVHIRYIDKTGGSSTFKPRGNIIDAAHPGFQIERKVESGKQCFLVYGAWQCWSVWKKGESYRTLRGYTQRDLTLRKGNPENL